MAFKGKLFLLLLLKPLPRVSMPTCWHHLEQKRQVDAHMHEESSNPSIQGFLSLYQSGLLPFPRVWGNGTLISQPQNSNIAQFNSFSTLVAHKKIKNKKAN